MERALTDKQALIQLAERMKLVRTDKIDTSGYDNVSSNEFTVGDRRVVIGSGDGYSGFYAVFSFDEQENIVDHAIWE